MQIGGAFMPPALAATVPSASRFNPDSRSAAALPPSSSDVGQSASVQPFAPGRDAAEQAPASNAKGTAASSSGQSLNRQELLEVARLSQRDQEVRAHEQAHASVGGAYAGAPSYTYARGPDGRRYAVGGEVSIDTGPVANDPAATLRKMEVVIRAALAPAEPSAQDRRVAAQAQGLMVQARAELVTVRQEALQSQAIDQAAPQGAGTKETEQTKNSRDVQQGLASAPSLDLYQRSETLPSIGTRVDMQV